MKFKGDFKKIRFFTTIALSAMAMTVATIGTFAWFQAKSSGANPDHLINAGSSNFTVGDVYGYKAVRQLSNGVPTISGTAVEKRKNNEITTTNIHKEDEDVSFDTPEQGVGYYVVGNAAFVTQAHPELTTADERAAAAWKYAGASKMTTNSYDFKEDYAGSVAGLFRAYMTAGTQFNIRQRDFEKVGDETRTKDRMVSATLTNVDSNASQTSAGANILINETATYNIYLASASSIKLVKVSSRTDGKIFQRHNFVTTETHKEVSHKTGSPTKKEASYIPCGAKIYFKAPSWWFNDNAYTAARFDDGGSNNYWVYVNETFHESLKIYSGDIPAGNWSKVTFYRMKANTVLVDDTTNINNCWSDNTSGTKDIGDSGDAAKICFDYTNDKWITLYSAVSFANKSLTGEFNSWNTSGKQFVASTSSKFVAQATGVSLAKDGVFKITNYGTWDGATGWENGTHLSSEPASGRFTVGPSNDNWKCTVAGTYDFYLDLAYKVHIYLSSITVTLDKQSGTGGTSSITASHDQAMPSGKTAPTRAGYRFQGYYESAGGGGTQYYDSSMISTHVWDKNATSGRIYAKWAANTYQVRFNKNGGTGTMDNQSFSYGESKTLTANGFTAPTGQEFAGWATSADGDVVYSNQQSVSNLTSTNGGIFDLFAKWTPATYTVTYNTNGGVVSGATVVSANATYRGSYTYGTGLTLPNSSKTTKTGYTFAGWYTDSGLTGDPVTSIGTTATGNKAYYAKWTLNEGNATVYVISDQWGTNALQIHAWGGDNFEYRATCTLASGYDNVYTVNIPAASNGFLFHNGTESGSTKTVDIGYNNTGGVIGTSGQDSYGNSKPSENAAILIQNDYSGGNRKWKWTVLPNIGVSTEEGFYLTSKDSRTSVTRMQHSFIPGDNRAYLNGYNPASSVSFQIWRFEKVNGGANWTLTHFDTNDAGEGNLAGLTKGYTNLAAGGLYNIYLNASWNIYIGAETRAYLILGNNEYRMGVGDNSTYNKYIYEASLTVAANDEFYVKVISGTTTNYYGYGTAEGDTDYARHQINIIPAPEDYLAGTSTAVPGTDYGAKKFKFKEAGRYTFYWTVKGAGTNSLYDGMAVAKVPERGNGYYIMPYVNKTTGYLNGVKMSDNGDGTYDYDAYKADATCTFDGGSGVDDATKVFVRSYVSAVDALCSTVHIDSKLSTVAKASDGIITLKAGRYNFHVENNEIYISVYAVNDHFSIDPLVSGRSIQDNYTSIVYEVPFTITDPGTGPFIAELTTSSIPSYLDWAYYVSASQITEYNSEVSEAAPYLFMRNRYFNSSGNASENLATSTHYAYIIIDYKAGVTSIPSVPAATIEFTMTVRQPS